MKSFLSALRQIDRSLLQRTKTISKKGFQRAQFRSITAAKIAVAGLTLSLGLLAMAKPSEAATTTLSFDQTPTLVSGTDLSQGAVYRFPSVATGIDAMVQVETIQNAQLKILDSNAALPARFQPTIAPSAAALTNGTSYVKFNFKLTPSSTPSGTSFAAAPAATATNVYFSGQDIDGSGTIDTIREFVEVIGALTSYIANPTLLQPSTPIGGGTGYEVVLASNVQPGTGTDDRYEIYSFLGESVNAFSIIGGNKTGSAGCPLNNVGCDRQNSWSFNVTDIQKLDFGDAPSIFGNAFHPVPPSPTVRLGASVDGDDSPSYTAAADGDGADDDGVASFPTLTTANTNYSLNLTCAGNGAFVAGWIDFNKNNTFDAGERAAGTCNGTTVTLNWSGLTGAAGNTYARLRISSTASEVTNPTGQASDGEVEDYPVSIVATPSPSTCGAIDFTGYTPLTFSTPSSSSTPTRYTNVGTFNGTQIDVVMTRTALTGLTANAPEFTSALSEAVLNSTTTGLAGQYTVRMDFFAAGTTTPINVNVSLLYKDLDGAGGMGERWEQLLIPASEVRSFTVANNSRLTQSIAGGNLVFQGTFRSLNESRDAVQVDYINRSSVIFTYEKNSNTYGNALIIAGGEKGFFSPPTCQTPSLTTVDYGDAPDSYGTDNIAGNSSGDGLGATHTIVSGLRIGSTAPDAESNASVPLNGTGDGADEGGVVFPSLSQSGSTYSIPNIPVTNTTGKTAYLIGWIDFDKNEKFDNDEVARVAVPNGTSSVNLTWGSLPGIIAGDTYARFRLTTDSSIASATNAVPNSLASDGEVEDYGVSIVAPPVISFKDRINSCGLITFDSNSEGFRAATITDSGTNYNAFTISPKSAPYANGTAKFEWQSIGNPGGSIFTDDLDGQWTIFTTPDFGTDTNFSFLNSKSLTFDYRSDTGISGTYDFWVALVGKNGNKVFYSFKTQLSGASRTAFSKVVVPMDATKWFTTFQTPTSAVPTSTSFAAILSNLDRIDIGAEGINGSDHTEIDNMGMACDRGDAPNTYSTLAAANGPSHQIISALKLGAKIDAENNGQPNATATGDNQDLSASNQIGVVNDEDGITTFPALTVGGTSYSIPAANITAVNTTGGAATLHAWIDFNKNGTFEATEYTATTINTSGAATGPLSWNTGFTIGSSGTTVARFRLTTDTSITTNTPSGLATDGEVEDYQVPISAAVVSNPNVLLVKRITAINGNTTNGSISLNSYDPETDTSIPSYPYDKNVIQSGLTRPNSDKWPNTSGILPLTSTSSTFLLGARNGGITKPKDTIEYTIYFLSAGDSEAKNVLFCDRVPANTTFIPSTFNAGTPNPAGLSAVDRGIAIKLGTSPMQSYTNINDGDIARYYPPLSEPINDFPKIQCDGSNTNGAVVVNLGNVQNATAPGVPTSSYGFIRFRGQVK